MAVPSGSKLSTTTFSVAAKQTEKIKVDHVKVTVGAELMGKTWIEDIRTWRWPALADDGVALLADR